VEGICLFCSIPAERVVMQNDLAFAMRDAAYLVRSERTGDQGFVREHEYAVVGGFAHRAEELRGLRDRCLGARLPRTTIAQHGPC